MTEPKSMNCLAVWTTRQGDEIPIKDLTDKHLRNILKMYESLAKRARFEHLTEGYNFAAGIQGEAALDLVEAELDRIAREDPTIALYNTDPLYRAIFDEGEKRGLAQHGRQG